MASQGRPPSLPVRKDHTKVSHKSPGTSSPTQRSSNVDKVSSTASLASAAPGSRNDLYQGPMSLRSPEDARGKFIPERQAGSQQLQRGGNGSVTPLYVARKSAPSNIPASTEIFVTAKCLPLSPGSARLLQGFVAAYNPVDVTVADRGFTIIFAKSKQGSENCFNCFLAKHDSILAGYYELKMKLIHENRKTAAPIKDSNTLEEAGTSSSAHSARGNTIHSDPVTTAAKDHSHHQTAANSAAPNKGTTNTPLAEQARTPISTSKDFSHALNGTSPARSMARTDRDETASSLSGMTGSEFSATKRPKCHRCRESGTEYESLVGCSTCKRRYHRRCHPGAPAVSTVNANHEWQCDRCTKRTALKPRPTQEHPSSTNDSAQKWPRPHPAEVSSPTTASPRAVPEAHGNEPPLKRRRVNDLAAEEATITAKSAVSADVTKPCTAGSKLKATAERTPDAPSAQDFQLDEAQRLVEDSFTAMETRPPSKSQGRKLKLQRRRISQEGDKAAEDKNHPRKSPYLGVEKPICPEKETTKTPELADPSCDLTRGPVQQVPMNSAHAIPIGELPRVAQGSSNRAILSRVKAEISAPSLNSGVIEPIPAKPKLKAKRTLVDPKLLPCLSCQRVVEVFPDMPSSLCKDCRKRPEQKQNQGERPLTSEETRPHQPKVAEATHEKLPSQVDDTQGKSSTTDSLRSDLHPPASPLPMSDTIITTAVISAKHGSGSAESQTKQITPARQSQGLPAMAQVEASALAKPCQSNQRSPHTSAQESHTNADDGAAVSVVQRNMEKPPSEGTPLKKKASQIPASTVEPSKDLEPQTNSSDSEENGTSGPTKVACDSCRRSHKKCRHPTASRQHSNTTKSLSQEDIELDIDGFADTELPPHAEASSSSHAQDKINFGDWGDNTRPKGTYEKLIEMAFSDYNGAKLRAPDIQKWVRETFPLYRARKENMSKWMSGLSATLTMQSVGKPRSKNLWTREEAWITAKSKKGNGGLVKEHWWVPNPEAFPRFHHFDRASRLAVGGERMTGEKLSCKSLGTPQKDNAGGAEVKSTDGRTPVSRSTLAPKTRVSNGKSKDNNSVGDDVAATGRAPSAPSQHEEEAGDRTGLAKQATDGRQNAIRGESNNHEDGMDIDPASQLLIGSSRSTSRVTSPESDARPQDAEPQIIEQENAAHHDITSDDSNDEPYLRYRNRRSGRSATQQQALQQPATRASSSTAESSVSPVEDPARNSKSEAEDREYTADDLYTVYPALRPQWLYFDKSAKMAEIKARPSRKQMIGKPPWMSRLGRSVALP